VTYEESVRPMRHALGALVPLLALGSIGALAAGCGDDDVDHGDVGQDDDGNPDDGSAVPPPVLLVDTKIARSIFGAGERINARCILLDEFGEPALDADGEPLTDSTELVITYRHEDSFAADDDGEVVAARVGSATVRCSAPSLDLVDDEPAEIEIVPGPAVRVFTELERGTATAGDAVGVTCLAFDRFDNAVDAFDYSLALSPAGAGTEVGTDSVTATVTGDYEVTCVVQGAGEVEEAFLSVVPGLPASLAAALVPEQTVYTVGEQVTLVVDAHDQFGNRVDDVELAYASSPPVASPSEARFRLENDGSFTLTAAVESPTQDDVELEASVGLVVDSAGPAIQCRRIDAPSLTSDAYMLQSAPRTAVFPVAVADTFDVESVRINGVAATLGSSGNYEAGVPIGFGMNFVDVVAVDQFGRENSTTCSVLAGEFFTPESSHMTGTIALRLDPAAIGDSQPTGLNSLNDILFTMLSSPALRALVNQGLVDANPISDGSCGVFACTPRVNYNSGSISWGQPTTSLSLVSGGLAASVTLPNVVLRVNACGTTCCIGGSNITVRATQMSAAVSFGLALQGGVLRASVSGQPTVQVGEVTLNGSGFCGFLIDLLEGFFADTVREIVRDALAGFIDSDIGPLIDELVSSLDITTLGQTFAVPRLGGSGSIQLGFGLQFSSLNITSSRALLGIGTRFTPGSSAHNRPSFGIARRTSTPLLDPPGTSSTRPVGISLYEGVLNQVLHGLWRGGFFQATLQLGGGTATIDARLPPVVAIASNNRATLMLGGIQGTVRIPGLIETPISIAFGGRASASVSLVSEALVFGNLTLDDLFLSASRPLTQNQRNALSGLLTEVLQVVLVDAVNGGLPAFPIPTFELPDSAGDFGLPPGAELGIRNPQLTTSGVHEVLTGGFGVRN
jgi:hypothetical protein